MQTFTYNIQSLTQEPWKKLQSMEKVVCMDQTAEVQKAYDTLIAQMNEYQDDQV